MRDFKSAIPEAEIYVYDNGSSDKTFLNASRAGAIVKIEKIKGKGSVVKSQFRDIDADIYILVDGDDTYPAASSKELIQPILDRAADMVVGDRISGGGYDRTNDRHLHSCGNKLISVLINFFFSTNLKDIMSGFRAFNKKLVKTIPINCNGFEIETELTLQCLDKDIRIQEIPIHYCSRPEGSYSKLNTFSDGFKIIKMIFWLVKDFKPITFFSIVSLLFLIMTLVVGAPVIIEFFKLGHVNILPSAILATGLAMISVISLFTGMILDTITKSRRDQFQQHYKSFKE